MPYDRKAPEGRFAVLKGDLIMKAAKVEIYLTQQVEGRTKDRFSSLKLSSLGTAVLLKTE